MTAEGIITYANQGESENMLSIARKAVQLLELANEEVYDTDDMPERWQGVFEEMEDDLWS